MPRVTPRRIPPAGLAASALLAACGEADSGPVSPAGTWDTGDSGDTADSGETGCPEDWTETGGVLVDPASCLAWSARAGPMTWHEAVSADEAVDGGCTAHCDGDPADWCADLGPAAGLSGWGLPDASTLAEWALRLPPVDDPPGPLWSATSGDAAAGAEGLAWTADLSEPGLSILADKTTTADVRCVTAASSQ